MAYGNLNVDTVTTSTAGGVLGAGNASIMKNRIINGAMVIDQRNAGASVTAGSGYTLDRWNVDRVWAGSTVAIQQSSTAPVGFTNSLSATVSTGSAVASGSYFSIQQYIEGFNVADMGWGTANAKTFTVSFWVNSSVTGTYGVGFRNSAFNRSYWTTYTIASANTWTQVSVTIAGDTSGTWYTNNSYGINLIFSLGVGSTNTTSANNSWVASSYLGAIGETNLIANTGATFYITGVQLEVGSSATGYEYENYTSLLSKCQRYFEKSYDSDKPLGSTSSNSAYDFCGGTTTSGNILQTVKYAVTKRASPTVTGYDTNSGTINQWTAITPLATTSAAPTFDFLGNASFRVYIGTPYNNVTGRLQGQWISSAEL